MDARDRTGFGERDTALRQRVGRFRATAAITEAPEFRVVMASCVIIRCEHLFAFDAFEYLALSPLFMAIEVGSRIPQYEWILKASEPLGQITVSVTVRESDWPQ